MVRGIILSHSSDPDFPKKDKVIFEESKFEFSDDKLLLKVFFRLRKLRLGDIKKTVWAIIYFQNRTYQDFNSLPKKVIAIIFLNFIDIINKICEQNPYVKKDLDFFIEIAEKYEN